MNRTVSTLVTAALLMFAYGDAVAEVSGSVLGGSLGVGAGIAFPLARTVSVRLGYTAFNLGRKLQDTGVDYDGKVKLSNGSGIVDWHPGRHLFKFSLGAVGMGSRVNVTGVPTGGTYSLGDSVYTAAQIGTVQGTIRPAHSVAPYIGLGFGNELGSGRHLTALLDIGIVATGSPNVSLLATCGASVPAPVCSQIQQDAATEVTKIRNQATEYRVWPVLNLGLGYRF